MLGIFSCACSSSTFPLGNVYSIILPIFQSSFFFLSFFFDVKLYELFIYAGY